VGDGSAFALEMPLESASLNTQDCFILDTGRTVYIWCGPHALSLDRHAAALLAECRATEHSGNHARATWQTDKSFWLLLGSESNIGALAHQRGKSAQAQAMQLPFSLALMSVELKALAGSDHALVIDTGSSRTTGSTEDGT